MIPYASRTGTRRNLDLLRSNGWRLLLSPTGRLRTEGFSNYALDNGAWTAHRSHRAFDVELYERALHDFGPKADFVVLPDVVEDHHATLKLAKAWATRVRAIVGPFDLTRDGPAIYVVAQDGSHPQDLLDAVPTANVFLGGSTQWKVENVVAFGRWCARHGVRLHVGRVNSVRRLKLCVEAEATSFDGSGPSRYAQHGERMSRWLRKLAPKAGQQRMPW